MTFLGQKVLLSFMGNANFNYWRFTYVCVLTFVLVGERGLSYKEHFGWAVVKKVQCWTCNGSILSTLWSSVAGMDPLWATV